MSEIIMDHDEWNYSPVKLPKASEIEFDSIYGVLPFRGVRNPSSRSATPHRTWFTYRTQANDWQLELGMDESAAEVASGHEALIDPATYDVVFQPFTVSFRDEDGRERNYTQDLEWVSQTGHLRLIFVRNEPNQPQSSEDAHSQKAQGFAQRFPQQSARFAGRPGTCVPNRKSIVGQPFPWSEPASSRGARPIFVSSKGHFVGEIPMKPHRLASAAAALEGAVKIRAMMDHTGLGTCAFRAVVRRTRHVALQVPHV